MINGYLAALRQLPDPPILAVIWRVALWTALIFSGLAWGLIVAALSFDLSFSFAWVPFDWLRDAVVWMAELVVELLGVFIFFVVLWLLFAAIVQLIAGFYLERVIAAVEARHFPDLPPATPPTLQATLGAILRLFASMLLFNLVALPFYLIPTVGLVLFYLLNGYLLGREYFEMVAIRRCDAASMRAIRRAHSGPLMGAGLITTLLLSLPLVNLIAPIITAAAMVHFYGPLAGQSGGAGNVTVRSS
jgi:uncharacterized protein involved in cysteine biosynthesis